MLESLCSRSSTAEIQETAVDHGAKNGTALQMASSSCKHLSCHEKIAHLCSVTQKGTVLQLESTQKMVYKG